jgi:hypothetical protein
MVAFSGKRRLTQRPGLAAFASVTLVLAVIPATAAQAGQTGPAGGGAVSRSAAAGHGGLAGVST